MEYKTIRTWDESLWNKAEKIYEGAFPAHSRKKRAIIQSMFEMNMCYLHLVFIENDIVAMALSGKVDDPNVLILDYIAVKDDLQSHGIGRNMVDYIKKWCTEEGKYSFIIVEVEAANHIINEKRIQFWTKCGFLLTDYVHTYIWVPEKYRAMYYPLKSTEHQFDGKMLFSYITEFHKKGYRKS